MSAEIESVLSHSAQETQRLGRRAGGRAHRGMILLLDGPLGVGKSVFAAGVAEALGIPGAITSPTFTIVNEYASDAAHRGLPFHHMDLYRIQDQGEFELLGLDDVLEGAGLCVIEWPDRAGDALPTHASRIRFEFLEDGTRRITYPAGLMSGRSDDGREA